MKTTILPSATPVSLSFTSLANEASRVTGQVITFSSMANPKDLAPTVAPKKGGKDVQA